MKTSLVLAPGCGSPQQSLGRPFPSWPAGQLQPSASRRPRVALSCHKAAARDHLRQSSDTGVGKSSIVCRFVQDHFDHNISPTIGASFMTKTVPCGNELHKFLIWDTAGQERFHSLAPMYYRGSAAAVIVYDITKQDSFHTLKKWVKELKEHGPENIVMAIAGNKCDLSDIREVPLKDAKEYAESIGAIVVETSAKNAINIEELFQGISRQIPPLDPHENANNGAIKLLKPPTPGTRRCC
ncbi:ras-related protein Rab-31 isoform X1 [Manis pentadactyla]|uniref:ras-related protein Rab-31 isoform X1 n=1 Tax=Manis pentadactyla TaxID=143292 RepID=UPI00255C86AB|nr:ras-related protein Rab-31 isoform X1 [Manis pentadactyla]